MFKNCTTIIILFTIHVITKAQHPDDTSRTAWKTGYLDIHHINTGRGVSTFFALPDGTTLLVDAGDMDDEPYRGEGSKSWPLQITAPYPDSSRNSGEWIADYIQQVHPASRKLDYALITHFHGDHMGVIKANTKTSSTGAYKLTGITQVGELIPIGMIIDRSYPENDFPVPLPSYYKGENSIFLNYQHFISHHQKRGMKAQSLKPGSSEQIILKYAKRNYSNFKITGVKCNGTIWTGDGNKTFEYFTRDSVLQKNRFNENPLSLALKISYGRFDYFTGGDNTGLQGFGLPGWFDVETPMAKAVGKVEVTTLNHHGNRDATNENFLSHLQPKVVVEQTWCSDHPGQEVMHRLLSDHLYKGEKNIFATNIQDVTKHTLGFWFTRGYKSMFGHIIVRVLPGGGQYYVLIAETIKGKVTVKKTFGPYYSE